ncbi:hypothetical protein LVJ83_02725 [Uruburuella testudinis]|uniref:Uncharacterized protein n=1 Tax=Uruburuella testudinis TaxID=1282863 RepID=A0ABY4DVB9_9NEIS|nr:hypothetical protein [Uruburuella testudinis]UOO82408.1 hypothetical protein LVJ83_02725 [Uruburuella testudinis]
MNHYTGIGLPLTEQAHFETVLPRLLEEAQTLVQGSRLTYYVYTDSSMAQLWLGTDDQGVCSFEPFFQGQAQRLLYLDSIYPADNGTALISAWPSEKREAGRPLIFSVPDGDALQENQIGSCAWVLLAAFAEDVRLFADQEAYMQAPAGEKMDWPLPDLRPAGQNGGEAYILLTGTITASERRLNEFGGLPFYRLSVATEGGELEAVADMALFRQPPQPGNVIQGLFWLSGRVLAEAV